jgi:transcriptional regulator with XRE-family HTH domain
MNPTQARRLGAWIRARRLALGLSTRQVAAQARPPMDMATVVRIERGEFAAPRPDSLKALAQVLDLPLADLFAMADYVVPAELPTPEPYLRAKYPQLPDEVVEQVDRYIHRLIRKHPIKPHGPRPGEDED